MDYPSNEHIAQVCNKHNQPIVCYEQANNKPSCLACLLEKPGMISAETYQSKLKEISDQGKQNHINNKQLYQNIYNSILKYKNSLVWSLDKILQIIQDQMKLIDSNQKIIQQQIGQNLQKMTIQDFEKQVENQQLCNEQFMDQIKQLLNELQKKYLTSEQLIIGFDEKQKIVINEQVLDWNKVECEITSRRECDQCKAFAFNKQNNILVTGCKNEIIIFQFINGVIAQELQRLFDHTNNVDCLYFMKKSNSFVSGSNDKSTIIWEFDYSKNNWFAKQKLQEHFDWVYCIAMNVNEDLLISGSKDQTIKFWRKVSNSWSCKQTIYTEDVVDAISLNEKDDKLISCGEQKLISIMERENDDQWRIVQTINMRCFGVRLSFTIGDQFIHQLGNGDYLQVYNYNKGNKQYEILENIQMNKQGDGVVLFPCQYIKKLKLISVKHGINLNLFKINQAENYQLIQSIEFQSKYLYGRLTDDGQYLVTYDKGSKEIQVRKLKFLK